MKRFVLMLSATLSMLCIGNYTYAQSGKVNGTVTDENKIPMTELPLSFRVRRNMPLLTSTVSFQLMLLRVKHFAFHISVMTTLTLLLQVQKYMMFL